MGAAELCRADRAGICDLSTQPPLRCPGFRIALRAQQKGSKNGPAYETQISAVPGFFLPALSYLFILRSAESPTEQSKFLLPTGSDSMCTKEQDSKPASGALQGSYLRAAAGFDSSWETGRKAQGCNVSPPCNLIPKSQASSIYKKPRVEKKKRNKDSASYTTISATLPKPFMERK